MNNQKMANKVRNDAMRVKKDIDIMVEDSVSRFSDGLGKWAGNAKDSVFSATTSMGKDVGDKLTQYNAKAQEVVEKVPGDLAKKAVSYPWVAISLALVVGFLLGVSIKPGRPPRRYRDFNAFH